MPRRCKRSRLAKVVNERRSLQRLREKELASKEKRYIRPAWPLLGGCLSTDQPSPEAGTCMVMECDDVEFEHCVTPDEEQVMMDSQEDTTTDQAQVTCTQDIETIEGKGNQAQVRDIQSIELNEIREQQPQVTEVQGIGSVEEELTKVKMSDQGKAGVTNIQKINPAQCEIYLSGDTEHEAIQDREQFICTIKFNPDYACDKKEEELVCPSSETEIVTLKQEEADFFESGNLLNSPVFARGAAPLQKLLLTQSVSIKVEPDMQLPCSSLMTGIQANMSVDEECGEGRREARTLLDTAVHLPCGTPTLTSPPTEKHDKSTAVPDFEMEYGTSFLQTQTKSFTNIDKRKQTKTRMEETDDCTESANISSAMSLSDSESREDYKVLHSLLKGGVNCRLNNAVKETSVSKSVIVPSVDSKNERSIRDETNLTDDKYYRYMKKPMKKYVRYNEIDEKRKDNIMKRAIQDLNLFPKVSGESKTYVEEKKKSLSKSTSLCKDNQELNNSIQPCRSENVKKVEYRYVSDRGHSKRCYMYYQEVSKSEKTQTEQQKREKSHQKVLSGMHCQDNVHGDRTNKKRIGEEANLTGLKQFRWSINNRKQPVLVRNHEIDDHDKRSIGEEANPTGLKQFRWSVNNRKQPVLVGNHEIDDHDKRNDSIMKRAIRELNLLPADSSESKTSVEMKKKSCYDSLCKDNEELELNDRIQSCRSKNLAERVDYRYGQESGQVEMYLKDIYKFDKVRAGQQGLEKPHQKLLRWMQGQDNVNGVTKHAKKNMHIPLQTKNGVVEGDKFKLVPLRSLWQKKDNLH